MADAEMALRDAQGVGPGRGPGPVGGPGGAPMGNMGNMTLQQQQAMQQHHQQQQQLHLQQQQYQRMKLQQQQQQLHQQQQAQQQQHHQQQQQQQQAQSISPMPGLQQQFHPNPNQLPQSQQQMMANRMSAGGLNPQQQQQAQQHMQQQQQQQAQQQQQQAAMQQTGGFNPNNLNPQQKHFLAQAVQAISAKLPPAQAQQINANPPPEIKAMAARAGVPPLQMYIRQQAFALLRQQMAQQSNKQQQTQQGQPQQPPQQQQAGPGPGPGPPPHGIPPPGMRPQSVQAPAPTPPQPPPPQQAMPIPNPNPQTPVSRVAAMSPALAGQNAAAAGFNNLRATPYEDQALLARNLAANNGVEVVPASSTNPAFSPRQNRLSQQQQQQQQQQRGPTDGARQMHAALHAAQFGGASPGQPPLSNLNRPVNPAQAPVPPPKTPNPPMTSQPSLKQYPPNMLASIQIPDNIRALGTERIEQYQREAIQNALARRSAAAAAGGAAGAAGGPQQRAPGPGMPVPNMPGQGIPQNAGRPLSMPQMPPMTMEQVASFDNKEVHRPILGAQLANQLPPHLKTWKDMKEWATANNHHSLNEHLRKLQIKFAHGQRMAMYRARQEHMLKAQAAAATANQQPGGAVQMQPSQSQSQHPLQAAGASMGPNSMNPGMPPGTPLPHNITDAQFQQLATLHQQKKLSEQHTQMFQSIAAHKQKEQQARIAHAAAMANNRPASMQSSPIPNMANAMKPQPMTGSPLAQKKVPQPMHATPAPNAQPGQQALRPPSAAGMPGQPGQQPNRLGLPEQPLKPEVQKALLAQLEQLMEQERLNPENRRPVNMSPEETDMIKNDLVSNDTHALIHRISTLLPMFVLLRGTIKNAPELIRSVRCTHYHSGTWC